MTEGFRLCEKVREAPWVATEKSPGEIRSHLGPQRALKIEEAEPGLSGEEVVFQEGGTGVKTLERSSEEELASAACRERKPCGGSKDS